MKKKLPSLDTPYGLGEANYDLIIDFLKDKKIENILELGSGVSTVRLAHEYYDSNITSIENKKKYYEESCALLDSYNIKNAAVKYCPLKIISVHKTRFYLTYELKECDINSGLDFVLIDGPVEYQTVRGREGVLYKIFSKIKKGGIIALDDYHRESSKKTVRNWVNTYGKGLSLIKEYDSIALLRKENAKTNNFFPGLLSIIDNWKSILIMIKRNRKDLFNLPI